MVNRSGGPSSIFAVCILLFLVSSFTAPLLCLAQKTVVQDAGSGRKQELVYDASGRIVETRTLAPDGSILQRNALEFKPGFYVPQQANTSYWPGTRNVKLFARTTFDENANFTGELVENYDEAGKHISGHKLVHDPQTGAYRCWNWDPAGQKYDPVECPSGEESSQPAEHVQRITYSQAAAFLAQARQAAAAEHKSHSVRPAMPTPASTTARNVTVGVVLPSHLVPGERVVGSVVSDPETFESDPDLTLTRMTVPLESDSRRPAALRGWEIEVTGSHPQPADSPISFTVPANASQLSLTLRQQGNTARSATQVIPIGKTSSSAAPSQQFEAPALLVKDDVCQVSGHFTGDNTFASVDALPAPIVAQTAGALYLRVPELLDPGKHSLIVADGSRLVAFPVTVAELMFTPQQRDLKAGESMLIIARLAGSLPDDAWRAGVFPPSNLERARKLLPGFEMAESEKHDSKEAEERERREEHGGTILLVIRNATPDNVALRGSSDQGFSFTLKPEAFEQGDFVYKFLVEARQSGPFALKGAVIPFLAPVTSQPFNP